MQTETSNNSVSVDSLGSRYKLRFDDVVDQPSYYRFEIEALDQAATGDEVEVVVNTDGGSLATGIEVSNAIFACKANTVGILRSNASSCGSIIFLACHKHEVGFASEMLLHSGGGGSGGTPSQCINRAKSYKRQVRALFETVYKGFISAAELDQMIDEDKEFIFDGEEVCERLATMYKYRTEQAELAFKEEDDALWQEELKRIESVLPSMGISEADQATFMRIQGMLGDVEVGEDGEAVYNLSEEDAITTDPEALKVIEQLEALAALEADSPSTYIPAKEVKAVAEDYPFLDRTGEIIGEINVLQFGDYVDNPVIVLTLIDKDTLRIDADLLLDERDAMLGVMNSLTGRTYGKYSTKVLAAQLVREVKKQIKENN